MKQIVPKFLRMEELEERIAPVVVTADSGWIQGTVANGWGEDDYDTYWIFYIGPGQANILNADGGDDLSNSHIGDIQITGSDLTSGLFILDYFPIQATEEGELSDKTPNQDIVPWTVQAGTIWVQGDITTDGDMGMVQIDGFFGKMYWDPVSEHQSIFSVAGTLGKFDVGVLEGSVIAGGDIYEIDVDTSIGGWYDPTDDSFNSISFLDPTFGSYVSTLIQADGNIGAIRVGVGLTDQGESVTTDSILGGVIQGNVIISANADHQGPAGQIDLIEVRAGSLMDGNLGYDLGSPLPRISAGPGGNVRFIRLDGHAWWSGPGSSLELQPITVDSQSPLIQRTITDDSGGVMIISPQDVTFTTGAGADQTITTYMGQVTYTIIPVDQYLQGPGVVIARLVVEGSNNFTSTGSVDVGELQIGTMVQYPEGLPIETAAEVTDMTTLLLNPGWAHENFGGTGETDIYFINAMGADFNPVRPAGGIVPVIVNSTRDGDIVAVGAMEDVVYIGANASGGDIGATEGITPYILRGPMHYQDGDVAWVDISTDPEAVTPFGIEGSLMRYNSIYGIFAGGSVFAVRAGGAIGDIRTISGETGLVYADINRARDIGSPLVVGDFVYIDGLIGSEKEVDDGDGGTIQVPGPAHDVAITYYGKITNTVGDGVFGKIMSGTGQEFRDNLSQGMSGGGNIRIVQVGEGLEMSWTDPTNFYWDLTPYETTPGVYVSAGIFTGASVGRVTVDGLGHGIYGDIMGATNDEVTGNGVDAVIATNGAVISKSLILGGSYGAGWTIWINPETNEVVDVKWNRLVSSDVGTVSASGVGSILSDLDIVGFNIHRVVATGNSGGMLNDNITAYQGGVDLISADGPGIVNTNIFINGSCGTIQTVGPNAIIKNSDIKVLAGAAKFSTMAIENDPFVFNPDDPTARQHNIYIATVNSLSSFDHLTNAEIYMGGIRTITVQNDVKGSLVQVAGPLDRLNVGGNFMGGSLISATGPFGAIGSIVINGGMSADSGIYSDGAIKSIQAGPGGILGTVTAAGNNGNGGRSQLRVVSEGDLGGTWTINHGIASMQTKSGDIKADIWALNIGAIKSANNITGPIESATNIGSILAVGNISGNITAGAYSSTEDIVADGRWITKVGTITAGGNISGNISIGDIHTDTNIAATPPTVPPTVPTPRLMATTTVGAIKAAGDINGNISVGNVTADGNITGNVVMSASIGQISTGGHVNGNITEATVHAAAPPAAGVVTLVKGALGSLKTGGSALGDLDIAGAVGRISAAGDVGQAGGTINVGSLGGLTAGSRDIIGNLRSNISVTNNAGSINISGAMPASISVGGNLGRLQTGGACGGLADTINVGGKLGSLAVGNSSVISDMLATVTVGAGVSSMSVSGDMRGNVTVTGNVGKVTSGRIFSDILIHGNLASLTSGSTPIETAPGIFTLDNAGIDDGSLTVDGVYGKVI